MSKRFSNIAVCLSTLALLAAPGCKKDDKGGDKGGDGAGKTTGKSGDGDKTPEPAKMVEMDLAQTGLKITLPEGAKIEEAIIAGADSVGLPGVQSKMVVKPRLVTDKEMDAHIEWAKGHQIQKFTKEIVKEGSGKTYTYVHAVDMGGMPKVVYMQMFQIGDKDFACFSNADDEKAAMAMKAACATVKAGAGGSDDGAANNDDADDDGAAADDDGAAKAPKKAPKKAAPKKDKGGW